MGNLVAGVHEAYKLILENRSPLKINFSKNVLVAIVQVIQECSQFVIKYPEIQTFCALVMPVISITILSFTRVLPLGKSTGKPAALDRPNHTRTRAIPLTRHTNAGDYTGTGSDMEANKMHPRVYPHPRVAGILLGYICIDT